MWRQRPGQLHPGQPVGEHKAPGIVQGLDWIIKLVVLVAVCFQFDLLQLAQGATPRPGTTREPPTVDIPNQGKIFGKEVFFSRTQKVTVYLGIPFAEPPVNDSRFSRPRTEHLPTWSGKRDGTYFRPVCMQDLESLYKMNKIFTLLYNNKTINMSEDCLFLNIYVPDGIPPKDGFPVMLWLHSGDFNTGATFLWDASPLAFTQKVVVVTTAYRLNVFGFFTTLDSHAAGNWGLWDQKAAIRWVKDKIKRFNGNPDQITIFGHGAGAVSVGIHMISKESVLFQGAIAMSGSSASLDYFMTVQDQANKVLNLSLEFNCNLETNDTVPCLRKLWAENLLKASLAAGNGKWGPVLDVTNVVDPQRESVFLLDMPDQLLQEKLSAVPFMTGYTSHEDAFKVEEETAAINEHILANLIKTETQNEVLDPTQAYKNDNSDASPATFQQDKQEDGYEDVDSGIQTTEVPPNDTCVTDKTPLSEAANFYYSPIPKTNDTTILKQIYAKFLTDKKYAASVYKQAFTNSKTQNTYLYRFDYRMRTQLGNITVPDWAGVPHQFELPFLFGSTHTPLFKPSVTWNSFDKKMADVTMSLFGSFARSVANASLAAPGSSVKWEPFKQDNPSLLIIDKNLNMSDQGNVDFRAFKFWVNYYPTVRDSLMNCCNKNSGAPKISPHVNIILPFISEFFIHVPLLLTTILILY